MHSREDLHWLVTWIDALELFVDFEDTAKLSIQLLARNVREVEIDALSIRFDTAAFVHTDVEDLSRRNVARYEVTVRGISLLEEVVTLVFWNLLGISRVTGLGGNPNTATFTTSRLAHQT